MQHPAAARPAPAAERPARPECGVCLRPIAEARPFRRGWVYHSSCSRCERPVCSEHIADADYDYDTGRGHTHCSTCVAELRAESADPTCAGCGTVAHHGCGNCKAWTCPTCSVFGRCCDAQGVERVQR